jgi:hypothetical protein
LHQHIRLHLTPDADVNAWLNTLYQMVKERKIKQLTLNIGFYDKCLVAEVTTWDLYRFWRSIKPIERLLA